MSKRIRQEKIREIIEIYNKPTQSDIVEILKNDYGIKTSRATISRDLKELGYKKNKQSKAILLTKESEFLQKQNQLYKLLLADEASFYSGALAVRIIEASPKTAPIISLYLEEVFSVLFDPFCALATPSGKVLMYFPVQDKKRFMKLMDQLIEGDFIALKETDS
ncbi:hypothetical protein AC623_18220 [Bacillus sp. FJAT-27231]|uniref:hypothetical protein n=1 Tax=Bacillus sp. FJAT-27231 TaxID=1679168 RepID=UPI000671664F|nr:hypothetical protein [Bacillus sp. FJAT-27231]KMY55626.1 hypothetical protein AC623_18220 [Bacillus sp. FJAT-27231]